ncbi:hypothetical protein L228DRAFT_265418 [Xylona heveae TC161]|uniref:HORMA domain-containing protein n=1 Tax=Xylona heveae (strain CBS 132557 / TC161) TaxID=1328760 RepID=A0A165IHN0_XYLHT|nr:hypothetical protein L228DRAFT_265418 [Xylona heveae TC161]KZF24910.1 hypothetical protein L228DRAFT_265418 [Xylona heveae TC161]
MGQSQILKSRSKLGNAKQVSQNAKLKHKFAPAVAKETLSTTQLVNQLQSFEIVETCLRAAISCLSYLRQLFPEECFEERYYDNLNRNCSYKEFVAGQGEFGDTDGELLGQKPRRPGSTLKLLVRGRSSLADTLLNWLEYGIFEAIELSYLEGLQLTIYADAQRPENVLETYTFTFQYRTDGSPDKSRLSSIEVESPVGEKVTIKEAKYGLQMLNMRLVALSTFLPQLPAHLFYAEHCPSNYEPKGFRACTSDNVFFPDDAQWKKQTESCGQMKTGFHSVRLRVSSLKWTAADNQDPEKAGAIPSSLHSYKQYSREDELEGRPQSGAGLSNEPEENAVREDTSPTESLSEEPDRYSAESNRKLLRKILETNDVVPITQDSDLISTQQESLIKDDNLESRLYRLSLRPVFSQKQIEELNRKRESAEDGDHYERSSGNSGRSMIYCEFCKTWQHLNCYGYRGETDPALPKEHICYECLLEPHEADQLRDLHSMSLLRKALTLIYGKFTSFPQSEKALGKLLHCTVKDAKNIIAQLEAEGFISSVARDQASSRTPRQRQRNNWVVVDTEEIRLRMDKLYFDPTTKIAHHCTLPSNPSFDEVSMGGMQPLEDRESPDTDQPYDACEPFSDVGIEIGKNDDISAEGDALRQSQESPTGSQQSLRSRSSTEFGQVPSLEPRVNATSDLLPIALDLLFLNIQRNYPKNLLQSMNKAFDFDFRKILVYQRDAAE